MHPGVNYIKIRLLFRKLDTFIAVDKIAHRNERHQLICIITDPLLELGLSFWSKITHSFGKLDRFITVQYFLLCSKVIRLTKVIKFTPKFCVGLTPGYREMLQGVISIEAIVSKKAGAASLVRTTKVRKSHHKFGSDVKFQFSIKISNFKVYYLVSWVS